jgi:hypothetical protein
MSIFKEYNLSNYLLNQDLESKAIEYLKKYPCCDKKNCTHPPLQSDCELWKNKNFYPIAEKVASIIFNHCNKKFNLKMRMWVYFQKKGTILNKYEWHNHYRNQTKEEFSFIIYLSDTDLGTLFKVDNDIIKLIPKRNFLYAWESKYEHTPEPGKHPKNRVVLAGDCLLG